MSLQGNPAKDGLPRREREKAAHRRQILEAAARVFASRGFAAATIDDIAREAEFSKGAVYLYFASKEELLTSILGELVEATVGTVRQALRGCRPVREELGELFRQAAEFAFSHTLPVGVPMPLRLAQFTSLSEETRAYVLRAHRQILHILGRRLRQAQSEGEVGSISVEAAAGLIHGALDSMVLTRWGRQNAAELQRAAANVIEILFDGIAARKEE